MRQVWMGRYGALIGAALALALAGDAAAQSNVGPTGAVHDPADRPPSSPPADFSHWEWYKTVRGAPIRDMIAAAEGASFDALQDRLGQVWLNADGAIGYEVSSDLVRLLARDPERALAWWLSHPGELDHWLQILPVTFITHREDDSDLPEIQALHAEVLDALDLFVGRAPWGRMREVAVCLGSEIAALTPVTYADYQSSRDPLPSTTDVLDDDIADDPTLPYYAQYWDGDWVSAPPADDAAGVGQALDFAGAIRVDDVEAVEILKSGVVVVAIEGRRALAFFPSGEARYLLPGRPPPRPPVICEGRR